MPISIRNTDLLYFPVPKIACTSIKYAILHHNEDDVADRIAPERQAIYAHRIYPSVALRPRHSIRHFRKRWFTVLRDPLKRFMSGYSNRILHHRDLKHTDPARLAAAGLPMVPDLDEFVARLEEYCAVNATVRQHFRTMEHFLGRRPQRFERIFTMAELDRIAPYCAEAGAILALPHLQTGGAKLPVSDLSPGARGKLMQVYGADYRIWGKYLDG